MNLKKVILGFTFLFILLITIYEVILHYQRNSPPSDPQPMDFEYRYVEIYKRFFKKSFSPNGSILYKPQRSRYYREEGFPAFKGKDTKRIFVLGGSVAMIFDENVHLKNLFKNLLPNIKFEIIGCGMGGYDSYRVSLIHKEILNYNPDLIIVMSGNNEFSTPVRLNLWAYRLNRLFRRLWIYRGLQRKIFSLFNKNPLDYKRISPEDRLVNFEKNLKVMIHRAKKRGVAMALFTLPANFRDCPPRGIPPWDKKEYLLAWYALENKRFNEAIKKFKQFLITYPENPFGYYFLAKCYEALKDYTQAQTYYLKALDLDVSPGDRCTPRRNEIIRRLCTKEDIVLIDLDKAFIKIASNGLLGGDIFVDNCHWWEEYYDIVYNEIIHSLIEYNKNHSKFILCPLDKWKYTLTSKDFFFSKKAKLEEKAFKKLLYSLASLMWPSKSKSNFVCERTISFIKAAYDLNPKLFDNKSFLKDRLTKHISENIWMQKDLVNFDKCWSIFLWHAAETFRRSWLLSKAIEYFNEAINLNPDMWYPYLGRGLIYYKMGETEKAQRDFKEADGKSGHHLLVKFYREFYKN